MALLRQTRPFRTNTQKDVLFIIGDWNAKVGSQEIPGVTGKFRLGIRNEATHRVLPRKCTGHRKHPLPTTQEKTTQGNNQMTNTKIRLIIFFAAKDVEALYSQQKQDQELTVAQIMNSYCQTMKIVEHISVYSLLV